MTTLLATDDATTHCANVPFGPTEQPARRADAPPTAAEEAWARIEPGLTAWKRQLHALDRALLRQASDAAEQARLVEQGFTALELTLERELGHGGVDATGKARLGARVQTEVLPYMMLSDIASRWYDKPRGYAGDYLSIAGIYADSPSGVGRIGPVLDRCFLNLAAARAVRNRRGLMSDEIRAVLSSLGGARPARVTSLACGPASELFDVFGALPEAAALQATLVDLDLAALSHVADRRDAAGLKRHMRLVHENLVHLATGRRRLEIAEQDLVYTIGLIDYFEDDMVVRLLDFIHGVLRPGGRAIVGNFHPRNPTRAMLDHVLDWPLIHRDEQDMSRLFLRSAFARPCARVELEALRINLFAVCEK